jgi:imidazolonepropionase-like amidohydrolase
MQNCWQWLVHAIRIPANSGVVEEGALADLLLVDGDPLANIKLLEDPAKNLVVIMKDGKICKNTVSK